MKSAKINIHEAKTHLSRLVEDVASGSEVLIAKGGRAMARLVPLRRDDTPRRPGLLKGKLRISDDFERPWTDTNFGNIFSVWDRIFGTFVYDDVHKIRYGLDVLEDKPDEDIIYQMKLPFDKTIKTDY